jgi:hypothetical protein
MHIRLIIIAISFGACEYELKAQAPGWHRSDGDDHRVDELAVILLMVMRVFPAYPTLEMGYVTLQICHLFPV